MPQIEPNSWLELKRRFERGEPIKALAREFGVAPARIRYKARAGAWIQSPEPEIRQRVDAKLSGVDPSEGNPEKKDAALDEEAERRARIIRDHRERWGVCRKLFDEALEKRLDKAGKVADTKPAFEAMKLAKIASEAVRILQWGERIAYSIDRADDAPIGLSQDDAELLEAYTAERNARQRPS